MSCSLIIGIDDVRRQMIGISGLLASLDQGDVDRLIEDNILAAQQDFEDYCQMALIPRVIKVNPDPDMVEGEDYDETEDPLDFYTSTYPEASHFTLRLRPVINVQRVRLQYGPQATLITYPADWIKVDRKVGTLQIVPSITQLSGPAVTMIGGLYWLPTLTGGMLNHVTPQSISIDYTAGIPDVDKTPKHAKLRIGLAQKAAALSLQGMAALLPTSASRDGVSASYQLLTTLPDRLETLAMGVKDDYKQQHGKITLGWI